MMQIENLSKSFGSLHILNKINLKIEKGHIYSLIGPNGSGKTTLFNIISGFLKSDNGTILFNGKPIHKSLPHQINRLGISRTFQDLRLINQLAVWENVRLSFKDNLDEKLIYALLPERILKSKIDPILEKTEQIIGHTYLTDVKFNKGSELSYGQKKLLNLATCIANDGEMFLLDEPVAGINPEYIKMISKILLDLKNQGKTILIIEHNTDFIESVSDEFLFLNAGKLLRFDTYTDLRNDKIVQEAYL